MAEHVETTATALQATGITATISAASFSFLANLEHHSQLALIGIAICGLVTTILGNILSGMIKWYYIKADDRRKEEEHQMEMRKLDKDLSNS